jgi:PAS domain S-box-containing protein
MTAPHDDHGAQVGDDERLAALARTTLTVLWTTRADGTVDGDNASWCAFTGQTADEVLGLGWLDAIHRDDRERFWAAWAKAVRGADRFAIGYRLRRRDGQYRSVEAEGVPVLRDGAVSGWIGCCIDVTERLRAQASAREQGWRLRFLDQLGEATRAIVDADEIMRVTARLLGELLDATRTAYADVEPDGDRFHIRNDWSALGVASSAGTYSLGLFGPQAVSNLRQGRHLVVRDVDAELGDEGGARMFNAIGIKAIVCAGLVKQGRLVAMMAVHQAEPRDWSDEEIAVVGEAVDRCWAHIERVRDTAKLREQDRRKDEFLATLAHELRNPLAPLRYASQIMRLAPAGGHPFNQAHDMIDRQIAHMARLVDDLLDVSRINRGFITLQREPVSLRQLMQQAVEQTQPLLQRAGHRLELRPPDEDVVLVADPARVVQVIGNLLHNAVKYTPEGGHIRLAAWRDGPRAVIEVTDNGIGIPPEQQGRLFQMFTQLHHGRVRAAGGLGIGLALVKTLVELHGGQVRVFSKGLDEGTSVTVELPLTQLVQEPPRHDEAPVRTSSRLRVLVIEDNPDGLAGLVALLDLMGYEAAGATDGPSGLEKAGQFRPQALLVDIGLPGMDGLQVARRLRSDPVHAGVVLVALTGWGAEADRQRTAEAGFDVHLTKPVEPETLRETLERLVTAG